MVINRRDIKRKRKDNSTCTLLDDSPKRTKVHAQRKFAQGSNVSSPVITPVKEIEKQERVKSDVLPEPQDLLPMNRPHTEDFLTFLCFRGTSMLPPNLNFFNAAPIDSRAHTQPLKKEPMNVCPPIASISTRTTPGTSERPFIAFGVRKRADPVLVSKHMDKKRRHALALQALRRKYQEQKMAKIRAVTISKLSEKITSKTLVRTTRSVTKSETVTKKTLPQKTRVKIVTTKRVKVKVTTRRSLKPLKAPMRPTLKVPMRTHLQKRMCLRSFRGRFIQHELTMKKPKKKKPAKIIKKMQDAKADSKKKKDTSSEFSSDDDQPLVKTVKVVKPSNKVPLPKIAKKCVANSKKPVEISFRVTRSHPLLSSRDSTIKRKIQLARSVLQSKTPFVKLAAPKNSPKQKPKVKEEKEKSTRVLRADRADAREERSFSPRTRRSEEEKTKKEVVKRIGKDLRKPMEKSEVTVEKDLRRKDTEKDLRRETAAKDSKKKVDKIEPVEKEIKTKCDKTEIIDKNLKKKPDKNVSLEKDIKNKPEKLEASTEKDLKNKLDKPEGCTKKKPDKQEVILKRDEKKPNKPDNTPEKDVKKKIEKPEVVTEKEPKKKPETPSEKDIQKKVDEKLENTGIEKETKKKPEKQDVIPDVKKKPETSTENELKKKNDLEKEPKKKPDKLEVTAEKETKRKPDISEKDLKKPEVLIEKELKKAETVPEKEVKKKSDKPQASEKDSKKKPDKPEVPAVEEPRVSQRPSRKTKEAAAIYMEILGHKLVSEGDMDDDSISIDSFPELPNVRKTEQRENELKARAKSKNIENSTDTASKAKCEDKVVPKAKAKKVDKVETATSEVVKGELVKNPKADEKVTSEIVKNIKELDKNVEETSQLVLQKLPKQDAPKNRKSEIFSDSDSSIKKLKMVKKADISSKPAKHQTVEATKKTNPVKPESVEPVKKTINLVKPESVEPAKKTNLVKPETVESAKKINLVKPETVELAKKINLVKPESVESAKKINLVKPETVESAKKINHVKPETVESAKKINLVKPETVESAKKINLVKPETVESAKKTNVVKPETVESANKINLVKPETVESAKKINLVKPEIVESAKKINLVKPETVESAKKINLAKPETVESAKKMNFVKSESVEPAKTTNLAVKPGTVDSTKKINLLKLDIVEPNLVNPETFEATKKTINLVQPETIEPLKKTINPATPEIVEAVKRVTRCSNKSMIDISFSESEDSFADEQINKERQKVVYPKRPALTKSSSSSAIPTKLKRDSRNSIKTRPRRPEESESESDESTTSKTSKMPSKTINKSKKIKLVKTSAAAQKLDNSFSDSDEEPLSKLTLIKPRVEETKSTERNVQNVGMEASSVPESAVKSLKSVLKRKSVEIPVASDVKKGSFDSKPFAKKEHVLKQAKRDEKQKPDEQPVLGLSGKPKRECTKRPQNYLPLFSSSEDEDKYFHGFVKIESAKQAKSAKSQESKCPPTPSADLLCKDVDKRFGKGKVNMSTEQIEKWLKESALAGSVVKKESDDILKYEEKPTQEISLASLPVSVADAKVPEKIEETPEKVEIKAEPVTKPVEIAVAAVNPKTVDSEKPPQNPQASVKPTERKMIFRKERKIPTPSANAFSPNNESSVYAFEAENEDAISTPFRRPARRPSSTATSRSEDSSKYEESSKTAGKFRLPSLIKQDTVKNTNKQEVSLMLSTDESNNSASIAVQLDIDSAEVVNTENSGQADAEDGEQLFYIPLQPGKQSSSQLIQGVAVKLGTTGANGPNQRVVMSAKLVTHTPAGAQKLEKPLATSTPMYPPATMVQKGKNLDNKTFIKGKTCDRLSENSEDLKYKVPSSPSASSSSSTKITKRQCVKSRIRPLEFCNPINASEFPSTQSPAVILEAPIFHPNEKEFQDPLEYIEKIRSRAEKFGICRIVPPSNFKPECKVADDMRFTAYNQYVHKMLHRWGPNFKELMAITKYLETQNIALTHPPWIGGMEIDLPRLYQIVQSLGGLKEVIEKKKWPKVSELMKIPRSAQDRVTKLDDIYCKYLLPYDTLSPAEREKLFDEVETEWAKRESRLLLRSQQKITNRDTSPTSSESDSNDEAEECIVKGRNMALNAFYRIARNTMSMYFKTVEPTAQDVEQEFWKHVTVKQNHICVHSGSIDSGSWGYGFAVSKHSPFARHAWNLKVLTNNSGSVLRSMGPVMGVTVPTLHVGMVFSACCWYRDPHSLPWIEYLHTGGNKIWYGIPDSMSEVFHSTLLKLVPNYCRNKSLWLPSDTAMIPPSLLVENGVSLCRAIQEPGQFVVVFPKAFTSSICTGYVVSESVYFAPLTWLNNAQTLFDELQNNCEPSMFSFQKLLVSIASDIRSSVDVLRQVIPAIELLREKEKCGWNKLEQLGLVNKEKLPIPDALLKKKKRLQDDSGDYECEVCCRNLFISWIIESQDDAIYCLDHATEYVEKKKIEVSNCKLVYTYDDQELVNLIEKMKNAIEAKLQKKAASKSSGGPS